MSSFSLEKVLACFLTQTIAACCQKAKGWPGIRFKQLIHLYDLSTFVRKN